MTTPNIQKENYAGTYTSRLEDDFFQRREIILCDEVNANTTNSIIFQLLYLNNQDPDAEITMYINSPGGEVTSGLALYDVMTMISAPITTICTGTAASMGSILFMAGKNRKVLPHAQVMIHDPITYGSLNGARTPDIQKRLDHLKNTGELLSQIYVERTGKSYEEVRKAMEAETYFTAQEAVDFGLATEIVTSF